MASTKSFFTLLAGLAAGAAFGILYAPDKGWKTRARVKKAAENGYEDLKENLGDLGTKVDEKTAEAKATLKDLRETLRTKGTEIKEGTRERKALKSRKAPAICSSSSWSAWRTP